MKKNLWIIVVLLIIVVIGGYYILINSTIHKIDRVDNIPYSDLETETTQKLVQKTDTSTKSSTIENVQQTTDEISPMPGITGKQSLSSEKSYSISELPGNTTSNLAFGGQLASDDEWEYILAASDNIHMINGSLYKTKKDGSELTKLTNDAVGSINIVGDWIYYIKWNEYVPEGIYRIKKDGTQNEQVQKGHFANMIIVDNIIYFVNQDDYNIYKKRIDGNSLEFILKDGAPIQYENGYLYYTVFPDVYRINLSNSAEPEKVAENVEHYIVYKDSVYYLDRAQKTKLMKKVIGDDNAIVLHDNIDFYFSVSDDKIFFMTEKRGEILTMDLDGNNIKPIPEGKYAPIRQIHGVVGDIIYYWVINDDLEAGADQLVRMKIDGSFSELVSEKLSKID